MKTWSTKKQEIRNKLGAERSEVLEITAQLINLIHKRRIELGLTQEQLAARVVERGGNLRKNILLVLKHVSSYHGSIRLSL